MKVITKSSSSSISIVNGVITIDGKRVDVGDEKDIKIVIEGDCDRINVDACNYIEVKGDVKSSIKTMSGDVRCGKVGGSISTMSGDVDVR